MFCLLNKLLHLQLAFEGLRTPSLCGCFFYCFSNNSNLRACIVYRQVPNSPPSRIPVGPLGFENYLTEGVPENAGNNKVSAARGRGWVCFSCWQLFRNAPNQTRHLAWFL